MLFSYFQASACQEDVPDEDEDELPLGYGEWKLRCQYEDIGCRSPVQWSKEFKCSVIVEEYEDIRIYQSEKYLVRRVRQYKRIIEITLGRVIDLVLLDYDDEEEPLERFFPPPR